MSGGAPLLYGFDINELYDFDLAARDGVRQSSRAAQPVAGTADPTTAGAGADARGFAVSTGDDTAAFFARHGSLGPTKFEYLVRARSPIHFRPYDLVVIPRAQLAPEHFTMSASGVVHVFGSEQPSAFLPLSAWMQQSSSFNVLTTIRFLHFSLAAKIFRTWRANVRYKLYASQRRKLARRLFVVKPAFCGTLLEINALCCQMRAGENTGLIAVKMYYVVLRVMPMCLNSLSLSGAPP